MFLTDEKRFLGTWKSDAMLGGGPTILEFTTNKTFTATIDFFLLQTTIPGEWRIAEGIIYMEFNELIPPTNYTYRFSEDSKTLTLKTPSGNDTFLLQKQQE